jgi:hypothetical protein
LWNQNNGASPGSQGGSDVAQRGEIIFDVLHHVEADHGIELAPEGGEIRAATEIAVTDLHSGAAAKPDALAGEVLVVDVGGDVVFAAAGELLGHIADTGAELEHTGADPWTDRIRHPSIEAPGAGEGIENVRAGVAIDVAGEVEADDEPERGDGIFAADLLAVFVGAAVIADGDFVDGGLALGELDGDFGLDAEAVAADGNAAP